jgi:small subunit ribosomal protein S6
VARPVARLYDLMLLVDASAPDERQQAIIGDVQAMLESDGTVVGSYDWGTRKIAFEIDHRPEATYHLFQFEGEHQLLDRLNHSLKIMDGLLRYRIIRQESGAPPVPPRPEPARVRRDEEPEGRVAARAAADAQPEQATDDEPAAAEADSGEPVVDSAEPGVDSAEPVVDSPALAGEPAEPAQE